MRRKGLVYKEIIKKAEKVKKNEGKQDELF
jgi:hypothetical protein